MAVCAYVHVDSTDDAWVHVGRCAGCMHALIFVEPFQIVSRSFAQAYFFVFAFFRPE